MPHDFHFLRPEWLWLLLPLALVLWRLVRGESGGDAWRGLVDAHLLPRLLSDDRGPAQRLPLVLLGLGWLLGVLALAGPTWERLPQPVYQAPDYRVIALDLSPSMNATDLPPSRLAHARFEVLDRLPKLNQEILRTLASAGGGRYVTAGLDDRDIETLIPARPAGLAQRAQKL